MKRKGNVCIALGALLIVAALGLTAYNRLDSRRAGQRAAAAMEQLEPMLPGSAQGFGDASAGETQLPDSTLDPGRAMPEIELDGVAYAAVLEIPALELKLPVISRWSYDALRLAPCRYAGSLYRNDLVIAGHNYEAHFGALRSLTPGDRVNITDMDGVRFCYEVADIHSLSPDQGQELTQSEWDLTLFTCTVGGAARLCVCCTAVE